MARLTIHHYANLPAAYHEYDRQAPHVAGLVSDLIERTAPALRVEHVGSTAVPGCGGKGVIDLLLLYPPGQLPLATSSLERLGFQHQTTRDPFPEERPMRTGAVMYEGTIYRLHVHVLANDSPEIAEFRTFRDRLRTEPDLVAAYTARKRHIIAVGTTDAVAYAEAKGAFCRQVLASDSA